MRVHVLDQPGLAVVDARLADAIDPDIRDLRFATEDQRQLFGKGDRFRPRQFRRKPAHEARTIIAGACDRLPEFNRVLGLEMAARHVIAGAGKGKKRDFPFGPQRIDAVTQCRMQSPIGGQRERRVRIADVGFGDAERGPRIMIEIARYGHHDIGGIVGAAQKHHQ